jgi:hypothetical protein
MWRLPRTAAFGLPSEISDEFVDWLRLPLAWRGWWYSRQAPRSSAACEGFDRGGVLFQAERTGR